jgi:hypothetical protein
MPDWDELRAALQRKGASGIGQLRQAAASLSPFDYLVTAALVAVYAVGTSQDEGPKTAAHLYVYLALMSLGILMLYLALTGPDRFTKPDTRDDED